MNKSKYRMESSTKVRVSHCICLVKLIHAAFQYQGTFDKVSAFPRFGFHVNFLCVRLQTMRVSFQGGPRARWKAPLYFLGFQLAPRTHTGKYSKFKIRKTPMNNLQCWSKNWPLEYLYTRMFGFKPIGVPPHSSCACCC